MIDCTVPCVLLEGEDLLVVVFGQRLWGNVRSSKAEPENILFVKRVVRHI